MRGWKLWTCLFYCMLFGLIAERAWASPPLTTIQDVIYKADGTRFQGVAYIEWKSFQAADQTTIATQSLTLAITDGNLRVRLVPTTNASPGAQYYVRYHADGKIQFAEYWAVPPSTATVNLAAVRTATGQSTTGGSTAPPANMEISDVLGLSDELAARPVRGFSYAENRVLRSGATGALEAVQGNLSDCVRVDGSAARCADSAESGSGGGSGPGFIDGESPTGARNGINTVFLLAQAPTPAGSLQLYRNGLLMSQGVDYALTANAITMLAGATPRTGDVLTASYRTGSASNPSGTAGGALTGSFPNPQLAAGVISNTNVAGAAGIVESKLALNFPTHSNAYDPTPNEKAALSGTAGAPSASNKYVTSDDSRMSNARTPAGHALLGSAHSDTVAGTVTRGDLIVGAGMSAAWSRLPLGAAGRCLMSNGVDAIWNTCLYTGFQSGAIPFANAGGSLTENPLQLRWDNGNRRFSIGSSLADGTLNVQDTLGVTNMVVRAGQAQGAAPLAQWQDGSGNDLARVESDGVATVRAVAVSSTASRAAWRETGTASDPVTKMDGDAWYRSNTHTRKTYEAGQTHTGPQVLCSSVGGETASTNAAVLASCTIPSGLLHPGDRVEVLVDAEQTGTAQTWTLRVLWGGTQMVQRTETQRLMAVRGSAALYSGGLSLASQSFGTSGTISITNLKSTEAFASGLTVSVTGWLAAASGDAQMAVRNLSLVRYPAQANP